MARNDAAMIEVNGPVVLKEFPDLFTKVKDLYNTAMLDGALPHDRSDLTGDEHTLYVRGISGVILAAACYFDAGQGRVWLDFIYVRIGSRRRGYATALINRVIQIARVSGDRKVMFGTSPINKPMHALGLNFKAKRVSIVYSMEVG